MNEESRAAYWFLSTPRVKNILMKLEDLFDAVLLLITEYIRKHSF